MGLYLINENENQYLVELPNDRHIQGEILWSEEKHGPLPDGIIVGAMDAAITYGEELDENGKTTEKEFDRVLVVNAEKKAVLDNEMAKKEAEKTSRDNKKKHQDNLVFKLKSNEKLTLSEVSEFLRAIYVND